VLITRPRFEPDNPGTAAYSFTVTTAHSLSPHWRKESLLRIFVHLDTPSYSKIWNGVTYITFR